MLLCIPLPFAPNYCLIHETSQRFARSCSQLEHPCTAPSISSCPRAASHQCNSPGPRLEDLQPTQRTPELSHHQTTGDRVPGPGFSRGRLQKRLRGEGRCDGLGGAAGQGCSPQGPSPRRPFLRGSLAGCRARLLRPAKGTGCKAGGRQQWGLLRGSGKGQEPGSFVFDLASRSGRCGSRERGEAGASISISNGVAAFTSHPTPSY